MFPQPADNFLPLAIPDLVLEFFESKVNDVVMMDFLRRDFAAQFEPDPVQ